MLVTGAGSVYGTGIIRALRASKLNICILAADINQYSLGLYLADKSFIAPPVSDEKSYYAFIKNLCKEFNLKAIFIGSSNELAFYAKRKASIEKSTGVKVFISAPEIIRICSDKWLTMRHLEKLGYAVPKTLRYPEDLKKSPAFIQSVGFPLIVKPRLGCGSKGVVLISDAESLWKHLQGEKDMIIQECISSEEEEFTVGICIDSFGEVISKIALKRKLQEGISIAAFSGGYEYIADYCAQVASVLKVYGAINIQLRLKDGEPRIFEINPRFSSSTGMRLLFGINEPERLICSDILHERVMPGQPLAGIVLRQYNDYFFPL